MKLTADQQTAFDRLSAKYDPALVRALTEAMSPEELADGIPYELEQLAGE